MEQKFFFYGWLLLIIGFGQGLVEVFHGGVEGCFEQEEGICFHIRVMAVYKEGCG